MNDTQRRLVLAVLPHLSTADRLIDELHQDGHRLEGSLLLGGDARLRSDHRVLLSTPHETPLWHVADSPGGLTLPVSGTALDGSSSMQGARERIASVARDLSDIWQELQDEHLGGDAVLGLLPLLANSEREARIGRTVLDHASGFFGLFELHDVPFRR